MAERPTIRIVTNGPYEVAGPAVILDAEGRAYEVEPGRTVKLCRCGHSATKPFCDSTHSRVDFVSRPSFRPES